MANQADLLGDMAALVRCSKVHISVRPLHKEARAFKGVLDNETEVHHLLDIENQILNLKSC